ncbi:MAG: hypothetical protein IPK83_06010 [Planctomycetes bacterium]|nr:hypothetical protein [Planctomycetota bacterium]
MTTNVMTGDPRTDLGKWSGFWLGVASLVIAAVIWLPLVHFFFQPDPGQYRSATEIPVRGIKLAQRHLSNWQTADQRKADATLLRASNPEWDLMSRGYVVLSLANMSLRDSAKRETYLGCIDRIIDDTLAAERANGHFHFLLPYARARSFEVTPVRSFHVDSQIGLMLAARCMLQKDDDELQMLRERVEIMQSRMEASPVLAAESYPNECWMFDIVNGLAVMRMCDVVTGTDHSAFRDKWLAVARAKLVDPQNRNACIELQCFRSAQGWTGGLVDLDGCSCASAC